MWNRLPGIAKSQKCGCPKCNIPDSSGPRLSKRKSHKQYVAEVRVKFPNLRVVEKYENSDIKIKHICKSCLQVWNASPKTIYNTRNLPCCSNYHNKRRTPQQYLECLNKLNSTLLPLESYVRAWKRILHRCSVCGTEDTYMPKHILRGHGCFTCAKDSAATYKRYYISVGAVHHAVQGYERFAIGFMLNLGIRGADIISSTSKGKPTFKYIDTEGIERRYIPDFFLPSKNRIIEVKSLWTLGLGNKPNTVYRNVVRRLLACREHGYRFSLLVFDRKGKRIILPKDWWKYSRKQLRIYLGL